jgi:hypothetical protein
LPDDAARLVSRRDRQLQRDSHHVAATQKHAALNALHIPLSPYTDPRTLTVIKAVHFTDLQARVR